MINFNELAYPVRPSKPTEEKDTEIGQSQAPRRQTQSSKKKLVKQWSQGALEKNLVHPRPRGLIRIPVNPEADEEEDLKLYQPHDKVRSRKLSEANSLPKFPSRKSAIELHNNNNKPKGFLKKSPHSQYLPTIGRQNLTTLNSLNNGYDTFESEANEISMFQTGQLGMNNMQFVDKGMNGAKNMTDSDEQLQQQKQIAKQRLVELRETKMEKKTSNFDVGICHYLLSFFGWNLAPVSNERKVIFQAGYGQIREILDIQQYFVMKKEMEVLKRILLDDEEIKLMDSLIQQKIDLTEEFLAKLDVHQKDLL